MLARLVLFEDRRGNLAHSSKEYEAGATRLAFVKLLGLWNSPGARRVGAPGLLCNCLSLQTEHGLSP